MRYLDLSETSIDRKAAEWLVQAVAPQSVTPPVPHNRGPVGSGEERDKTLPRVAGPWDEEDGSEEEGGQTLSAAGVKAGEESESLQQAPEEAEDEGGPSERTPKPPLFDTAPLLKEDWSGDGAAVQSLRLENCGLRGAGLEVLGELAWSARYVPLGFVLTRAMKCSERLAGLGGQARLAPQEPDQPRRWSLPRHHDAGLPSLDRVGGIDPLVGVELARAQLADDFPERLFERDERRRLADT